MVTDVRILLIFNKLYKMYEYINNIFELTPYQRIFKNKYSAVVSWL